MEDNIIFIRQAMGTYNIMLKKYMFDKKLNATRKHKETVKQNATHTIVIVVESV